MIVQKHLKNKLNQTFILLMTLFFSTSLIAQSSQNTLLSTNNVMDCASHQISAISPASGSANAVISITGNGFSNAITSVKFNGVNATFSVVSTTLIKATVPVTAVSGTITVSTSSCTATSVTVFNVLNSTCANQGGDIFISELYDAPTGAYGVVEFYNPTNAVIVLNGTYELVRYGEIGNNTISWTLPLTGSIPANSTFLAVATGANSCPITANMALTSGINENDEFRLLKNGTQIDIARAPNHVGYTVKRVASAIAPAATYAQADWSFATQSCADLGSHTSTVVSGEVITSQPSNAQVCTGSETVFTVAVTNASQATFQWKMLDSSGNWINVSGSGFSGAQTNSLTVTSDIALNNTQFYCQISYASCFLISNTVQITVSALPEVTLQITQPTCTILTGTLTVTPVSGNGLTYSIDGGTFQSAAVFSNINPGVHQIRVKNSEGCIAEISFTVQNPPAAPATPVVTVTQPTCSISTATVVVTAPVGAGLTYSLDNGTYQSSTTFSNVTPGAHIIKVKNAEGCTSEINVTIQNQPATPAQAATTITQPTCTNPTAAIQVTAPLGSGFSYSIDGGTFQTSPVFSGIAAGNHTLQVKNAAGCISEVNIVIQNAPGSPDVPVVVITQPTCNAPLGALQITTPVGNGLTYSLDGVTFQNQNTFTNIQPGTYTLSVKNTAGCITTKVIVVNEITEYPLEAVVKITQPTCAAPNATVQVLSPLVNGYQYSIDGVTFQSQPVFNNLQPGTYTMTVKNAGGCISTHTFVVNQISNFPPKPTVQITQPDCTHPTATIVVLTPSGNGLTYSIDGTNYQNSKNFENVIPGTYRVYVKNNDGCIAESDSVIIIPSDQQIAITGSQGCIETPSGKIYMLEAIAVNGTDNLSGVTYIWTNSAGTIVGENKPSFNVSEYVSERSISVFDYPLEFEVTLQTANGCETSVKFVVESVICDIPKGISPNGDGLNDNFDLVGLHVLRLTIFNRDGREVYSKANYKYEWSGQSQNGNLLPSATYFYVIDMKDGTQKTGWVYLIREIQ